MEVIDPSYARSNLSDIIDEVNNGKKFIIESRGKRAILLSKNEYDGLIETIHLLSDPEMARDIADAKKSCVDEMVTWQA